MSKRNDYIEKMKHQLDEFNNRMNSLDAKAHEAKEDVRAKYKEEVGKLKHQSKLATDKLRELTDSGDHAWDSMVAEMDKVRDAFKHSFTYFKSQL
jgi:predicted  nucleic acid-binding Zn-ribbon protein